MKKSDLTLVEIYFHERAASVFNCTLFPRDRNRKKKVHSGPRAKRGKQREAREYEEREREKMDEVRDTARSKRSVLNERGRERKKKGLEGEMGRDRGRWWS